MKPAVTLAALALLAAGCGGGKPAVPAYSDASTCRTLASVTQFTATSNTFGMLSREVLLIRSHRPAFSPGFRRDVLAVINTGLGNPPAAAVAVLQADCASHGVTAAVWPRSLTGN